MSTTPPPPSPTRPAGPGPAGQRTSPAPAGQRTSPAPAGQPTSPAPAGQPTSPAPAGQLINPAPVGARPRPPTTTVVHQPRHAANTRPGLWLVAAAAVVVAWLLVVLLGPRLEVSPGVQELARFGHLAALALGLGAALTVEWFGLLWLVRRRPLSTVTLVAQGAHVPIWLGLAGLAVTGTILTPDQLTTTASVKLAAVLVVALNGLYAGRMQHRLTAAGPEIPRPLLARAAGTAMVSQLGWWSAMIIGFLSAHD